MYLIKNRKAQDPVNHIVEYWIKRPDREYVTSRVEEVLQGLVEKGVVDKVKRGGRVTYKLNDNKREEVLALLNILRPNDCQDIF
jgi:predicted transcriptional regulator